MREQLADLHADDEASGGVPRGIAAHFAGQLAIGATATAGAYFGLSLSSFEATGLFVAFALVVLLRRRLKAHRAAHGTLD